MSLNRILRHFLAVTVACLPTAGQAAIPFVRAPEVWPESFAARAVARPDFVPLADFDETSMPTEEECRQLTAAFSRAQSLFLDGSVESAARGFRDVVRLARDSDWREAQRRAIAFSYLRLAQLADASSLKQERIEAAAAFAPDLRPDADAFPPPMLEAWAQATARLRATSVSILASEKFAGYDVLKIDGRAFPIRPGSTVSLAPGAHRISALSNSHPYFSQILTSVQLEAMRLDQAPLASGDCEAPQLRALAGFDGRTVAVAYPDCVRLHGPAGWAAVTHAPAELSRLGVPPPPESGGGGAPAWAKSEAAAEPRSNKQYWIWAAVGAMAVAVGYAIYRAQPKSGGPSAASPPVASARPGSAPTVYDGY